MAKYKYSSDKDGVPSFAAKNLVGGFVRNLEDYRKYLMVCFRCHQINSENEPTKYKYMSYWVVNTNESLQNVIGSFHEDFEFTRVDVENIDSFLKTIERTKDDEIEMTNIIAEKYLH
jgi:Mg2+ and Co2+ transporter CorA